MQSTISLLGYPQSHIGQGNRDSWHIHFGACACLYFITTSLYLLALHNLAQAVLKLHIKHPPLLKI